MAQSSTVPFWTLPGGQYHGRTLLSGPPSRPARSRFGALSLHDSSSKSREVVPVDGGEPQEHERVVEIMVRDIESARVNPHPHGSLVEVDLDDEGLAVLVLPDEQALANPERRGADEVPRRRRSSRAIVRTVSKVIGPLSSEASRFR